MRCERWMLGKGLELLLENGGRFEINQWLFTDDTALVADVEDRCVYWCEFRRACERRKPRVNVCKSTVMRCSSYGNNNERLNGEPCEEEDRSAPGVASGSERDVVPEWFGTKCAYNKGLGRFRRIALMKEYLYQRRCTGAEVTEIEGQGKWMSLDAVFKKFGGSVTNEWVRNEELASTVDQRVLRSVGHEERLYSSIWFNSTPQSKQSQPEDNENSKCHPICLLKMWRSYKIILIRIST